MRFLWLLVACSAALAACDSSGGGPLTPAPSTPTPALVPLAVGNAWVFTSTRTSYNPQTGEPGATQDNAGPDTLRVVESRVRDGETWFRLDASQTTGGNVLRGGFGGWVTNRSDGFYRLVGPDSTALREVAYPVAVGDVYSVVPPFSVADTTRFHFERTVAVKRTDYPVAYGGTTVEGVLFTGTLDRLFVSGRDYGFAAWTPPLREIYAPGVGFAYLETGYAAIRGSEAVLPAAFRFVLNEAALVVVD